MFLKKNDKPIVKTYGFESGVYLTGFGREDKKHVKT